MINDRATIIGHWTLDIGRWTFDIMRIDVRYLVLQLVLRDFRARYKQTFFGASRVTGASGGGKRATTGRPVTSSTSDSR